MATTYRNENIKIGKTGSSVVSFQEEDAQCPICKSDKYLTPNLKLLVSPCFHKMCESCIDRLFSAGPAPCPLCYTVLRKNQFQSQIFEDLTVEKEVRNRKDLAIIFNKRPEDFPSKRSYDDYLEMVEDYVFNLTEGVDVAETEAKIQAYEKENKDIISVNATRYENEKRAMKFQDRIDKEEREQRHQEYVEQLEEERRAKQMEKADIITELATTNKSAQAVIQTRQATALKRSSALRQQQGTSDNNSSSRMTMPSYITTAMDMDTDMRESEARNFDPLDLQYEYTTGYTVRENYNDPATEYLLNNKQAKAGGYSAKFAHQRALMSAFTGLLCQPPSSSAE